jgi:hypothetical protein
MMIYYNEPGYANTNSNIESFNATIKRDFFKRKRFSVYGAILKLEEIIKYYSKADIEFHTLPKFVDKLNKNSLLKTKKDFFRKDKYTFLIKSITEWLIVTG